MKKVLVAGAALMLVSGIASTASAAAVEPGVKITGDARVRLWYTDDDYLNTGQFGTRDGWNSQSNFDSRVRVVFTGTTAGGTYAKARIRFEGGTSDLDAEPAAIEGGNGNLWADWAYVGIPFTDNATLELGRYRSTYGPLPATNNFFYDDVSLQGARGIIKFGNVEVNPFFEWMEEGTNSNDNTQTTNTTVYPGQRASATATAANTSDFTQLNAREDNDVMRLGVHAKGKVNKDWTVGGMLGYQIDERPATYNLASTAGGTVAGRTFNPAYPADTIQYFEPNEGFFASLYVSGKTGAFGLNAEFAVTDNSLNNFNSWENDVWVAPAIYNQWSTTTEFDKIGSKDTGYGGYVFPTFTIDKLTLGLNAGFTAGGFQPDRAFGFVMAGTGDNSRISAIRIGDFGDWLWVGFVPSYQFNENLKLTANFVYADISGWDSKGVNGEGPNTTASSITANTGLVAFGNNVYATTPTEYGYGGLSSAYEISAILQYTIMKGTDLYLSAGYLKPEAEGDVDLTGVFGAISRLEIKF